MLFRSYEYASKSRLASSLEDCQQRQESAEIMERSLRALQASLDAEAARKLENYLEGQRTVHELELEAMFCAGFSIGQELSRS